MAKTNLGNEELVAELEKAATVFGAEGNAPGLVELAELVKLAADRLAVSSLAMSSAGAADALFERQRQIEQEGWTPAHDDEHEGKELAQAAAAYLVGIDGLHEDRTADDCGTLSVPVLFPKSWAPEWWKPGSAVEIADYRRRLVKGVALGIAEIDRVDRVIAGDATHGH